MKRLDFLILVTAIRTAREELSPAELVIADRIARRIADGLAESFKSFDRTRFLTDCGLSLSQEI